MPERIVFVSSREEGMEGKVLEATFFGDRIRRQIWISDGSVLRISTPITHDPCIDAGAMARIAFPADAAIVLVR